MGIKSQLLGSSHLQEPAITDLNPSFITFPKKQNDNFPHSQRIFTFPRHQIGRADKKAKGELTWKILKWGIFFPWLHKQSGEGHNQ